jgi:hypothetical protein
MLNLQNLDEKSRNFMVAELDSDIKAGTLYLSPRLNDIGRDRYPKLLRQAIQSHDDSWLADNLRAEGCFKDTETRQTKRGVVHASVPVTAADTLAEGEFNRFYARGLCRVAIEGNIPSLIVYRAKDVSSPRSESERMIGKAVDPAALLNDLRTHTGMDTALHLPPGPNSGLSVCLS